MTNKFRSYVQGLRKTALELGDKVPPGMEEGDEPSVGESDMLEYMRGQIVSLVAHVKRKDAANARIANDVSCRANGIIPD
jgi:hypothetical protein